MKNYYYLLYLYFFNGYLKQKAYLIGDEIIVDGIKYTVLKVEDKKSIRTENK